MCEESGDIHPGCRYGIDRIASGQIGCLSLEGGDLDDLIQEDFRRPLVAATKTAPSEKLSAPQIMMSAIADIDEFTDK